MVRDSHPDSSEGDWEFDLVWHVPGKVRSGCLSGKKPFLCCGMHTWFPVTITCPRCGVTVRATDGAVALGGRGLVELNSRDCLLNVPGGIHLCITRM